MNHEEHEGHEEELRKIDFSGVAAFVYFVTFVVEMLYGQPRIDGFDNEYGFLQSWLRVSGNQIIFCLSPNHSVQR